MEPQIPRKLTQQEIQDILNSVPKVRGYFPKTADSVNQNIFRELRYQLENIELVPKAIPELKERIRYDFYSSRIPVGERVGALASTVMGRMSVQLEFDAKRNNGVAQTVSPFDKIKNLLKAQKEPKDPVSYVFFKEPVSKVQILTEKRPQLQQTMLSDIVIRHEIMDTETEEPESEWPQWKQLYNYVVGNIPDTPYFLRLYLNIPDMINLDIHVNNLVESLSQSGLVVVVPSPMDIGHLDLYPDISALAKSAESKNQMLSREGIVLTYLTRSFIPVMQNLRIKGIPGILDVIPESVSVLSAISGVETVDTFDFGLPVWRISYDQNLGHYKGIMLTDILKTFLRSGLTLVQSDVGNDLDDPELQYIVIEDDSFYVVDNPESEFHQYRTKIMDDPDYQRDNYKGDKPDPVAYVGTKTDVNTIHYARLYGANLLQLLARPDVDETKTYDNLMRDIYDVLGVGATRTFFLRESTNILQSTNPQHLMLTVDNILYNGEIAPISAKGIKMQDVGPLAVANMEKASETLQRAALMGVTDPFRSTAAGFYTGSLVPVGSGDTSVDVRFDPEAEANMALELRKRATRPSLSALKKPMLKQASIVSNSTPTAPMPPGITAAPVVSKFLAAGAKGVETCRTNK